MTDVLDEIQEGMKNKNPQVKTESLRFLVRCLRTTPFTPTKGEIHVIGESCTKLLADTYEPVRAAAQEALGTLMKIVGERQMVQFLDGVDDIRKAKIKEFFEKAEIKARARPEPKAAAPKGKPAAGGPGGTRPTSMRPAGKSAPAPLKRPTSTISVDKEPDSPKKTGIARPGVKPPGAAPPASRLAARQSLAPARTGSPTHAPKKPVVEDVSVAAPKLGRGLLGRVLPS